MKCQLIFPILAVVVGAAAAQADVPRKMPLSRYYKLWNDSPFTTKPTVNHEPDNPFLDYALGGVAPVPGGYQVTLLNRKKPDERMTLLPNQGKFRVLEVRYDNQRARGVTVRLTNGSKEGTVTYDEKLLTLKTPSQAPPNAQQRGQQGLQPPGQAQPPVQPQPPVAPGAQPAPAQQGNANNPPAPRQPRQRVFPNNR